MSGGNYGDGAETMEYQAKQIAENVMNYNGSAPCPTCGVIINPVEFLANRGHCTSCLTQSNLKRVKGKMA
jgi:hypothetical protein